MPEPLRKVRPTPTTQFLANPHRGCCTYNAFNGDPLNMTAEQADSLRAQVSAGELAATDGYLPCTVAYFRWFWSDFQLAEDRFDFSAIERALENCRRTGQTLIARVMPYGGGGAPQIPAWYAAKYPVERGVAGHPDVLRPNHDSPEYLNAFGTLLRELGSRFDKHPQFEGLDMSFVGPWGEGGSCSVEQAERFAKVYQTAFPRSFRFSLTDLNLLSTAIPTGAGWRADAFGDLRKLGSPLVTKDVSWNHMYDVYPRDIGEARAGDAWKRAPVLLETFHSPKIWSEMGYDIPFLLRQALKYHATFFNPKYTAVPTRIFDSLAQFCANIGYNFVFRQACYQSSAKTSGTFKFTSWIENTGVAPLYRNYTFALRLRQGDREEILLVDDADPRTWLPGDIWINREIALPPGLKPGNLELAAGIVDSETGEARVSFAAEENFSDRWLALGYVELAE
jgi:hypothetical protein